jgi:hypothetical protein
MISVCSRCDMVIALISVIAQYYVDISDIRDN